MAKSIKTVNLTTLPAVSEIEAYSDTISQELGRFGLSENQAVIYLAMIKHGALRIQEITKITQVSRTSVYEGLTALQELGLIEQIVEQNFTKFKAYTIQALRHHLNDKAFELQKRATELDTLEGTLHALDSLAASDTVSIRYYKDISGARQLLWNTLKAKETMYVYSAWGRGRYVGLKFYENFVSESRKRKIQEQVLVNPLPRVLDSIKTYAHTNISRTDPKDIRVIPESHMQIKGETFIYDSIYSQVFLHNEKITGFEIESQDFVDMQRSLFELVWNSSHSVSEFFSRK